MTGHGERSGAGERRAAGILRAASLTVALLLGGYVGPARAAKVLDGTYALPNGSSRVTATLTVPPGSGLQQTLDTAMTPVGAAVPVARYETELSKQLHLIAVSADLRDFVHEHGDAPGPDGHFQVAMTFPHPGLWHVYADGTPEGLGQQVMRFDVVLGEPTSAPAGVQDLKSTGLTATDGSYAVRFDNLGLVAGQEVHLALHLLHDGNPAADITPFLGVAAHAVFIDATDLSYVHVHAAPAEAAQAGAAGAVMQHDMAGADNMPGMAGMASPLPDGASIPSGLELHVHAPKAGAYVLWVQFNGGGKVRTVRFVVPVRPPVN